MIGGSTSYRSNALSPGIEPRRTAPEADALSIELGEHYSLRYRYTIAEDCQDILLTTIGMY